MFNFSVSIEHILLELRMNLRRLLWLWV